jgi:hypothetical protein
MEDYMINTAAMWFGEFPNGEMVAFDCKTHKIFDVELQKVSIKDFSKDEIIEMAPLIAGVDNGIPVIKLNRNYAAA